MMMMMKMCWMQISIVYRHLDLWPGCEKGKWYLLHMITTLLLYATLFGRIFPYFGESCTPFYTCLHCYFPLNVMWFNCFCHTARVYKCGARFSRKYLKCTMITEVRPWEDTWNPVACDLWFRIDQGLSRTPRLMNTNQDDYMKTAYFAST